MRREQAAALEKKVAEIVARYPRKQAALLPVLHFVQGEVGFVGPEEEAWIGRALGLKPIKIREVATFYTMIMRRPIGRYHIQVCANLTCTLLGSQSLLEYLQKKLGCGVGETTADQKFTLSTVECLGACEQAPCLMVNRDYYGQLDKERLDSILDSLQ